MPNRPAPRPVVRPPVVRVPSPRESVRRQPPVRYGNSIITFINRSGQRALVRLVGPTRAEVAVPNGGQNSIRHVAGGHYVIYVRYGTPGNERYARGDDFHVQETATSYSQVTMTLHGVMAGNYAIHDSTAAAFAAAAP